jgi:MiaB/RimO family radical SAM methylthiotransferase
MTILKVYISTNGCEEAQLSSAYVEQFLRKNKVAVTKDPAEADLILFYACGLTKQSEKDSLMVIRSLKAKMKPSAKLLVWGCLSKINPQILSTIYEGPMIGPKDISFFEKLLENTTIRFEDISANTLIPRETFEIYNSHNDALVNATFLFKKIVDKLHLLKQRISWAQTYYIRVATGCTGHCTYCSERCALGKIRSRPLDKIISEFERGLQKGYNLFFLVATDLGAYGKDIGYTLLDVLSKMIENNYKRNYKIILDQINPYYVKEMLLDLKEIFASGKIQSLCSPVQSGSNRILKLMGRTYRAEEWRECMLKISRDFPNIGLKTHFMVGFPTETDEDFKETLKLLDPPLFLDGIGIFKFSVRPTTYASWLPEQVSEEVKELRYRKLLQKYARMYVLNFTSRCMRGSF